ncbi:hypothetical protein Y1Q_0004557 [Alligator mississippiensis]|uniref:Uncharacterized protein n=1 Tax=Alligator mississippiensis TaxID=8496 RepID=A0A151P4Z0_ALLMI|nr:hypothetical protein Y1Q_0004557 [Alligator mississippiensis]
MHVNRNDTLYHEAHGQYPQLSSALHRLVYFLATPGPPLSHQRQGTEPNACSQRPQRPFLSLLATVLL